MYEQHLAAGRKKADQLHHARTLEQLDALYVEWIGYSILAEDPEITFEILNDLLEEYLNEVLASTGVAWIDAHADPDQAADFWREQVHQLQEELQPGTRIGLTVNGAMHVIQDPACPA